MGDIRIQSNDARTDVYRFEVGIIKNIDEFPNARRKEAEQAVAKWSDPRVDWTNINTKTIFNEKKCRIDRQGFFYDENLKRCFANLHIQTGSDTVAIALVEVDVDFGASRIRRAFVESLDHPPNKVFLFRE